MRARLTFAVVATFAIAACDSSPTESKQQQTEPVDPMTAQAASTGCSNRCGYVIPVAGTTGRGVYRVTEDARLLGYYTGEGGPRSTYRWSRSAGTVTNPIDAPAGETGRGVYSRNSWGQAVGTGSGAALAWEPNGTRVTLRDRASGKRIMGIGKAINENSVIVGDGYLEGDPDPRFDRAFRYHYQDGLQFLTPEGTHGRANDVNASGMIVGGYLPRGATANANWFIWTSAVGLKVMGRGEALAVSDNGHVVVSDLITRAFLYTPQGDTVLLPQHWEAVDVNDWGEVLLTSSHPDNVAPGTCGAAVWYKGYGLLRLTSPDPGATSCQVSSINSWGDVAGTVSGSGGSTPVVWTWKNNAYRYVAQ